MNTQGAFAPREGFHAARIPFLDLALWDVVGTLGIAWGIARYLGRPLWEVFGVLLVLSILVHWVLGFPTQLLRYLHLAQARALDILYADACTRWAGCHIYLRCTPEVALERIRKRGRTCETTIEPAYLRLLCALHDEAAEAIPGAIVLEADHAKPEDLARAACRMLGMPCL